jgi:hypothetical protein
MHLTPSALPFMGVLRLTSGSGGPTLAGPTEAAPDGSLSCGNQEREYQNDSPSYCDRSSSWLILTFDNHRSKKLLDRSNHITMRAT